MQYLALTAKVANADHYIGWFADNIAGFATSKTRAEVEQKPPRLLTRYFSGQPTCVVTARSLEDVDSKYLDGSEEIQTLWVASE